MSFPISLGSVVEIVVNGRCVGAAGDSVPLAAVLHYACGAPGVTPPDLAGLLVAFHSGAATPWAAFFPNAYTVDSVTARFVNDGTSAAVLDPNPGDFSGTGGTGDFLPTEVAAFIEKLSGWRYRGSRPGLHTSPVLESLTTDFRLTAGGVTALNALKAGVFQAFSGAGAPLDVYVPVVFSSKYSPPDPVTKAVIPYGAPVTSTRVRKTLGRMVRRKVKGVY